MITKFESFENSNIPQIGDYVACIDNTFDEEDNKSLYNFIKNNIGHCIKKLNKNILVKYENIPTYMMPYFTFNDIDRKINVRIMTFDEIKFFSPDKKLVEDYIEMHKNINKYNL
jgi:hypothetical protein